MNSFSLLLKIRHIGDKDIDDDPLINFCLFALIGIQISYPKVFRLISKSPVFPEWDKVFGSQIGVDEISVPDANHEYTDEPWEQVLWCYCQNDPYLKTMVLSIIQALNILKIHIEKDFRIINKAMEFASMTSVDDDLETKDNVGKFQRTIFEGIEGYLQALIEKGVDSNFIEFMQIIDKDFQKLFETKDGVKFLHSKTGGMTLYAKSARQESCHLSHSSGRLF